MSDNTLTNKENNASAQEEYKTCENCHAKVQGMYCSQCGQSVESTLRYFWSVILHLLDDIFSFDSRASRTLFPLIFKPGFLTNEYIIGRRVHYVPPLRLYLFVSIIFFLSLKFLTGGESHFFNVGNSSNNLTKIEHHLVELNKQKALAESTQLTQVEGEIARFTGYKSDLTRQKSLAIKGMTDEILTLEFQKLDNKEAFTQKDQEKLNNLISKMTQVKNGDKQALNDEITFGNNEDGSFTLDFLSDEHNKKLDEFSKLLTVKAKKAFAEDTGPLIREAIEKLPQLMFILLPLFAALLKIMFIFSKRLYLEHLTVALHSHSFIFLSVLLIELIGLSQSYVNKSFPSIVGFTDFLVVVIVLWIPLYLFIMQKKVYKQGYLLTTIKFGFIGITYMLMIVLTGTIAFIWGLAST
ncbi:DUF3667 domain-containing protein [Colwelliaceae bacterium 6441]